MTEHTPQLHQLRPHLPSLTALSLLLLLRGEEGASQNVARGRVLCLESATLTCLSSPTLLCLLPLKLELSAEELEEALVLARA